MAKKGMRRPDASQAHGTESNKKQYNNTQNYEVPESKGKNKKSNEADDLF